MSHRVTQAKYSEIDRQVHRVTAKSKKGIKACLSKSNGSSLYLLLWSSQFTQPAVGLHLYLFDHLSGITSLLIVPTPHRLWTQWQVFPFPAWMHYLTRLNVLVIKCIFITPSLPKGPVSLRVKDPSNSGRDKLWPEELQRSLPALLWLCCCARDLGTCCFN